MHDRRRFVPGLSRVVSMTIVVAMTAVTVSVLHGPPAESPANAADLALLAAATAADTTSETSAQPTAAAVDYFLKIDSIHGESTDRHHEGEIDLLSWSWGGILESGPSGRRTHEPIKFLKRIDKASPLLALAAANGTRIGEAILTCRKAGGDEPLEYLKIELKNVFVSSYNAGGSTSELPTEELSLNFEEIKFTYTPQRADGTPDDPVVAEIRFGDGQRGA